MCTMLARDAITFVEDDLPQKGKDHNDALFITIGCKGKWVPKVLIVEDFGVNIIPLLVTKELDVNEEKRRYLI